MTLSASALISDPRLKLVERTIKKFDARGDALLEVLNTAQEAFGYLPQELIKYVARELHLPLARVYGVATFYHMFSFKPLGEHTCIVCLGTACYVKGAAEIVAALEREFNLKTGQTTPDGKLSVSSARCLGSCGLAPVAVLDGNVVGKETPEGAIRQVRALVGATQEA
jgi:bidirectional [NiFe] hydrogenase diaphorase subunit